MKNAPVNDADKPFHWQFYCQWPSWFSNKWKFRSYTILHFHLERGEYKGKYVEIEFGFMGLILNFEWIDTKSRAAFMAEMDQRIQDIKVHPEAMKDIHEILDSDE